LWYQRHPEVRRRLSRPVISVGNLTVGGSRKTPIVASLARLLLRMGERPAILSRGYARRDRAEGVVVVSDGARLSADLARAGDEPLMLARAIEGAAVLVSPDRYLAGRLAERRFNCSVHLLDDGFQTLALERDVELLLMAPDDVRAARPLPAGRLREPLETARLADALVVTEGSETDAAELGAALGVDQVFHARRGVDTPHLVEPAGKAIAPSPETPAIAVAGVARPERFFSSLREAGWVLAREMAFPDHHPFSSSDVAAIADAARASGAQLVLTTEKDLMRLLPLRPIPVALAWVPLTLRIEPAPAFRVWLEERLAAARQRRSSAGQAFRPVD
jgi:tetraacyldisaccharide 4'-kinase